MLKIKRTVCLTSQNKFLSINDVEDIPQEDDTCLAAPDGELMRDHHVSVHDMNGILFDMSIAYC